MILVSMKQSCIGKHYKCVYVYISIFILIFPVTNIKDRQQFPRVDKKNG